MPKPNPDRRVGPSAPTAGLAEAIAQAEASAIPADKLPAVLAEYRAGCPIAARVLHDGTLHLVFRVAPTLLGPAYLALRKSLATLKTKPHRDPNRFIRNAVRRFIRQSYREQSPHLLAPRSTKSDALQRGGPDPDIRRAPNIDPIDNRTGNPTMTLIHDIALECSAIEFAVWRLRVSGYTEVETAAKLEISRWRVRRILAAIRARFA